MRRTLTDKGVVALRPRTKRYTKPDPGCLGHYIRVMPSGAKSYTVVARNPFGKQVWVTLGNTTNHTIAAAANADEATSPDSAACRGLTACWPHLPTTKPPKKAAATSTSIESRNAAVSGEISPTGPGG